ncbi:autotransporter outer membrane beta-barrel domain-containing protein [Salmonella enterica]|nr:autotransporter outer membrane beta-barrel domain-containing protein [Salmonella enterica]
MNKTYNIIWNAARGMYIVTSELARSGSRAIVSVSASCAVTLLAMDAAPAVAEETRVSIPSQTTTYTLSGATPFVVETGNTIATDTAASAAIVGDNSNDWDLLIESGAVVGSSLTDSQAMNLDSLTGATSVHNQGTITGSNEDGTIMLQNGGSVINDALIENSATYEHDPEDIPQEYAGVYMLNGGSYVSSESGVLEGVSGVIVQSGEAHITNGGMINSDGSWRSYGVEFRDGTYGTIVNTGTIITTASDGSGKIEDAAIYVHTLNDMAVSGSVSVDNSGLMQSDFITVALYYGSHFEVVNRVGGVITAGNSSLVGIKSTAMELKVGVDNLVTNDGTISAYGTANTYGIHYGESTSGGVITNTGSITTTGGGAGDASVYVHGNGDGTVVNNSGTMSSIVYGVYLDSARSKGHTLNNQAGGAISANTAVAINGNGNTITNQGKMTGVSDGLLISGNNNIVITSGGEISGKNGIRVSKGSGNQITAKSGSKITTTSTGISIAGGNNQITTESGSAIVAKDNGILINSGANNVTNGGSITATGSSISYGIQYNSGTSGTITNTGTITTTGKGAGDASVYAHGGAVTINNSGTMDSSVFGVYVTTGHTLNNLAGGSITANTAVQLNGNNNTLANAGAILGDTNGVTISGSGNTLTNQGKITGGTNAVLISSGSKNNTITLNTGTEMSGSITDGNNSASANNNLILDGEGTLGSSISGLNSVTSSGDWTLSGATMNLSGTTNSALWVKSGTLIVNGAMTAKGATVDSGTTLQIGNSGTLGAFNGDIVDNGTLTFNRSDAAAYGSVISGSGNVVKQGGGELTLSNNNSYSGGTTIAEGTLTATAGGALGSGNIDNRAYLKLDAASASDPFIVADLTTHSGATVEIGAGSTLQANTLTQQDGSTLTADLTATSGPAIRAKNVNLDGTLNVASPASQEPIRSTDDLISLALIESDNAISGDFDDITINGNAMNPDAFITVVGQKNVNDTHYDLVETLTWYADRDNAAIDAHGTFNLADADDSFTVNTVLENVDANSGWNGQSLTKTGAGTLILNAENTYTGGTTISGGTLVATNVEALGSGDVTDNATLEMNTGGDFANNIGGTGSVVKSGDKTLTLSGANSYTGGTTISGGTLVATNVEALGTGSVTDNATLELNTGGDFDNAISGSGQVVKSGDKTLTLSGANSYSGATTISGGTLIAANVNALGTGAIDNRASLLLDASGQFAVTDLTTESGGNTEIGAGSTLQATTLTQKSDSTLTINLDSNTVDPVIHAASQVSLAGTLDITGVGDVLDSDPASTDDLDTFTLIASDKTIAGDFEKLTVAGMDADLADFITVDGRIDDTGKQYELTTALTWYADRDDAVTDAHGTFNLTNADGSFAVNTVLENVDATLDPASATGWDGTSLIKQGAGTLILNAENTYTGGTTISGGTLVATNVEALGSGDVTDDATLELNTGGTFDNAISGSGQVVKSGDKTLTLSGNNTYTGGTTISEGTLVASNVEALGTGDVTDNATLEMNTGGDFDNAISGSGQVVKSGDETLTLSGANSYTGGTIISGGTLVATNVDALGTGDVTDNATLELNTGGTFDNAIGGSGKVEKSGDDALTLSGRNTYTGGTTINDGTLVATSVEALGSGDVTNDAVLALNTGGDFANNIGGTGSVVKSGDETLTLSGSNTYTGGTLISSGTLVANDVNALGTGDVTDNATLMLNTGGDFINNIGGTGRVEKSGDDTLTLSGSNTYTGGTLISGGTLVASNVEALGSGDVTNNAVLELNTGGTFDNAISGSGQVVKSGDETLTLSGANSYTGGTTINDGTLIATSVEALGSGDVTDNATLALNTGGTFDNTISGSGKVEKSGDDALTLSGANSYTGGTLISGGTLIASNVEALGTGDVTDNAVLELNTGGDFDNAISGSGQVVKSGDKTLTLSGSNTYTGGTLISGGTLVASNVEALGSGDIDNYASLQLNASGQFVTANLTTHDNATTAIGAGSALRANTLTQEANSTLAVHLTDSNSGAIVTADRANLGGTLDITGIGNVTKSWTRDAYSYTLIDTDSAIDSDFAQFTVAGIDAKQVDFLTVDGRVNADDDTRYDVTASLSWYADSDNAATNAHGTFTLSEQGHSFTLNTALTDVDATLNPDSATDWDGKSLIKRGAGTLILGAQNTYSGDTDVQEGALWLAETATIGSAGSAQAVNIAANAAFGGHNATVNGHVNNQGSLYFVDTFTVNGDVVNSSAMISGSDQPNNTLTIAGNYTGNDGHLYLNTQLGDDNSPTDKLIVTGDTAGSTTLHITNVNGLGAQTVNGIEVIEVGGQSDGDFTLYKGHVDINAWTYTLKQDGGDWYLRSESDDVPDDGGEVTPPDDGGEVTPPDDGGEVTPPDDGGEVTPPDDGGDVTPPDDGGDVTPPDDGGDVTPPDDDGDITPPDGGDVTPVAPQYRADIGVYLGNQWMARNLQMQTLYDREGSQYRSADGSIWMRFKAGKAESQAVNGNVDIDSDYSQFQLGGDILTWSDGAQSVTVGLMGSYINASTDSTGNRGADGSQFSANGSVDGYNLGLYATWFADAQSHRGAYIDSWYQYGAYNNSVDNDGLSASRYDSAAHAVSLETGYRYDIALSNRNTVSLTPQAQVTWQRYSADTVIDDGGTRISGQNDDSWTTRLGVRVDGKLYKESGRIQPFMEVNWLHASDNASATFGDTKVSQDLPNDRVEVKVGIQANVSERLSVYAQAAGQKGKNDYGDASFSLNMRYNW